MSSKENHFSLKSFRKFREDKDHAYFRHSSGHEMKVKKSAFSEISEKTPKFSDAPKLNYDEGGTVEDNFQPDDNLENFLSSSRSQTPLQNQPQESPNAPLQQTEDNPSQATASSAPQYSNLNLGLMSQNSSPTKNLPTGDQYQQLFEQQKQGIQKEAEAQSAQGRLEAQASQESAQKLKQLDQNFQSNSEKLLNERHLAIQDYANGNINSNRVFENMSTLGKVSTTIGLILGGFGSGLTGQPNAALQVLNNLIERDINDQVANMNKKQNLVSAYQQQFGNLKDATEMAKSTLLGIASLKLQQAAALSKDPLAQSRALQAKAAIDKDALGYVSSVNLRNSYLNQGQGGGSQGQEPDLAMQIHYSPLVDEKGKQEALEELKTYEGMMKAKTNLLNNFDQAFEKDSAWTRYLPGSQSNKIVKALMEPAIAQLSKDSAGKFTEKDSEALSKMLETAFTNKETHEEMKKIVDDFVSEKMNFPKARVALGRDLPTTVASHNFKVPAGYQVAKK